MIHKQDSPLKWIWGFAILAILVGIFWVYFHISSKKWVHHLDRNETFTLQINASEGGEVFGSGNYLSGTRVTISAIPNIGYTFGGWEGSERLEKADFNTTFQILDDMNLSAQFKKVESNLKLSGDTPITIRDFEGFETSQYFEDSGKKMLSLKFDYADVEKPKIGFLRMGLAFLMVRNLEILVNTDGLSANFIFSKIEELKNHKGVSYAVAEPITFWFMGNGQSFKISAHKGKLTSDGSFRLWGGVKISKKHSKETIEKLEIKIAHENKSLIFTDLKDGAVVHKISLD